MTVDEFMQSISYEQWARMIAYSPYSHLSAMYGAELRPLLEILDREREWTMVQAKQFDAFVLKSVDARLACAKALAEYEKLERENERLRGIIAEMEGATSQEPQNRQAEPAKRYEFEGKAEKG